MNHSLIPIKQQNLRLDNGTRVVYTTYQTYNVNGEVANVNYVGNLPVEPGSQCPVGFYVVSLPVKNGLEEVMLYERESFSVELL
jgi:hypothetical protein